MSIKATEIEVSITFDDGQTLRVKLDDVTRWSWDYFHETREKKPAPGAEYKEYEKTGRATIVVSGAGRVVR